MQPQEAALRPRLTSALLAVWAGFVAVRFWPGFAAKAVFAWDAVAFVPLRPRLPVFAANLGWMAATAVAAVLLIVILARVGSALFRWLDPGGHPAPLLRGACSFPVGYAGVSAFLLGLLLLRLWFPAVLAAIIALLAVAAFRGGLPRVSLPGGMPAGARWVLAALCLWLPWMLVPEAHEDAWTYHLAAPRRWLDLHGLALTWTDVSHHFPLPVELVYAFPLRVALDAVPKWLNAAAFLSGAAALAIATGAVAARTGWLLIATMATGATVSTAKSDGFAAGAILAAFAWGWVTRRRVSAGSSAVPAGLLAGIALAAKPTAALNLVWVPAILAAFRPRNRAGWLVLWSATALVPLAPWLVKSALLTGDPFYPGPGMIMHLVPSADRWLAPGSATFALVEENPALAWIAVAALLAGGYGLAFAPLAVYAAWFAAFPTVHTPRFAFPCVAATAILAARSAETDGPAWRGRVIAAFLLVAAANRFAGAFASAGLTPDPFPFIVGAESRSAHVGRGLSGVEETRRYLAGNRLPGAILLVAEWHSYGMPQPVYQASADLRQPPGGLWNLVRCSAGERDLSRRFRQMNIARIIYNPVRALNGAMEQPALPWTDRELRLWESWFRRWTLLEHTATRMDYRHGVLFTFLIRSHPGHEAVPWMLPGVETLFGPALRQESRGEFAVAYDTGRAAYARLSPVLEYSDTMGLFAFQARRYPDAYRLMRPSVDAGFVDGENYFLCGISAFLSGRHREALEILPRAAVANPHRAPVAHLYAATSLLVLGVRDLDRSPASADRQFSTALDDLARNVSGAQAEEVATVLHAARSLALASLGRMNDSDAERVIAGSGLSGLEALPTEKLREWVAARIRQLTSAGR